MNKIHFETIVCFGEVLWDMLPGGAQPGGAPMNVAIHLKQQGLNPWLVSRTGNDEEGEKLRQFLQDANIDPGYLQVDSELPTSRVLVHLDKDKNATYEICEPVAWDNIQLSDKLEKIAKEAGLMIFGSLAARNETTRKTLLHLLDSSRAIKLLDVNLRPPYDSREWIEKLIHKADFVKLNDDELMRIAKWSGKAGDEAELTRWLSGFYNCRWVCVTKGARGAIFLSDGKLFVHQGFKVNAVDTVGAGDAFLAALIAQLSEDKSSGEALAFACATGAFVASKNGAVPAYSRSDILALME